MNVRALIKRSIALTCAYYVLDNWRAHRRLARGDLRTGSGTRHATLDLDASLRYVDRVYRDYLAYGKLKHFTGDVAEIGPGDNFGIAVRILGDGATAVHALDRWRPLRDTNAQRHIYEALAARPGLGRVFEGPPGENTIRGLTYHTGRPAETFFRECALALDAILSRAVMEHLYDPIGALDDMAASLKPDGLMVHRIDLRDHGMFAGHHPLTFLTVGETLYRKMARSAGRPNRVLMPAYREWLARSGLGGNITISRLTGIHEEIEPAPWDSVDPDFRAKAIACVRKIRPRLASPFTGMADEDLAVSGCVLVARKTSGGAIEKTARML